MIHAPVWFSLRDLDTIYQEMGLAEPFVFAEWRAGEAAGLVTGFIKKTPDGHKYLDVDHMIVRPTCKRKFATMMMMSEAATQAAFDYGCAYILLSIFKNDPRRAGLSAWAKRMNYQSWAESEDAEWFVRHNPTYVYEPRKESTDGQGREGSSSEAASGGSRSER